MRELKFRAWDEIYKRWRYITVNHTINYYEQTIYDRLRLDGVQWYQFTGLQDKNSVDIYEGDIIKTTYGEPRTETVTYDKTRGFEPLQVPCDYDEIHLSMDDVEVIGNVHEEQTTCIGKE